MNPVLEMRVKQDNQMMTNLDQAVPGETNKNLVSKFTCNIAHCWNTDDGSHHVLESTKFYKLGS